MSPQECKAKAQQPGRRETRKGWKLMGTWLPSTVAAYLLQMGHRVRGQDALVKEIEQRGLKLLEWRAVVHPCVVQHQVHNEEGVLTWPARAEARLTGDKAQGGPNILCRQRGSPAMPCGQETSINPPPRHAQVTREKDSRQINLVPDLVFTHKGTGRN